jgi:hypothetical protein
MHNAAPARPSALTDYLEDRLVRIIVSNASHQSGGSEAAFGMDIDYATSDLRTKARAYLHLALVVPFARR